MKRLVLVLALVAAVAVGCGGDDAPEDGAEGPEVPPDATLLEGDAVQIRAIDNSFQPEAARIRAGTEVTFVNDGRNDHNVIPEDEDAAWLVETDEFHPGDESSFTFDDPGVYRYYCSLHGELDVGMFGVLVVE